MPTLAWLEAGAGEATREVVRTVALLAGAGAVSAEAVRWLDRGGDPGEGRLRRSCLDAGSHVIVSLPATGGRAVGVLVRDAGDGSPGVTRMVTWDWTGAVRTGWRRLYAGEPAGTWADVLAAVGPGGRDTVARWHGVLGTNARIYSVGRRGDGPPWVAWQLDPRVLIGRALDALGVGAARPAAEAVLQAALGSRPPERGAPWSLAVASDGSRWRIGTSRWARCVESDDKRRRLASVLAAHGGDRDFAEGVYKVVAASAARPGRVGRAIEVEFALGPQPRVALGGVDPVGVDPGGGDPVGVEFFLAVPSSVGPAPGAAS
jgi:hypothetical protein